jgi:hypothetical protein
MTTINNITIQLLTKDKLATDVISKYANWVNLPNPFTTYYNNKMWTRTKDILVMVDKPKSLLQQRSNNRVFYVELGSQRLVDTGVRNQITDDARLLVTWLHNPCSVAVAMLTTNRTFNAWLGGKEDNIPPQYKYPQLMQLWKDYQDKLALDEFLAA